MQYETAAQRRAFVAHVLPMGLFVALLALTGFLTTFKQEPLLRNAVYWIYPLQTVICGGLLIRLRSFYQWGRVRRIGFTLSIAVVVFLVWILPQQFFGWPARTNGFDPGAFGQQPWLFWPTVLMRFARLVLVVPVVEEIFWRAFLLRYLVSERFESVPFGKLTVWSFSMVTVGFGLSHSHPDWAAAFIAGAGYNIVAWRTRSLSSCIAAHATTNLLLGLWIMQTEQWGFW